MGTFGLSKTALSPESGGEWEAVTGRKLFHPKTRAKSILASPDLVSSVAFLRNYSWRSIWILRSANQFSIEIAMSQRFLLVLVVIAIFVGCSAKPEPTAPAAVGFQLESVAAGITKLKELNGTIKAAFDAGIRLVHSVARDEAPPKMKAVFLLIDTNFDGQVTLEELTLAIKRKRERDAR